MTQSLAEILSQLRGVTVTGEDPLARQLSLAAARASIEMVDRLCHEDASLDELAPPVQAMVHMVSLAACISEMKGEEDRKSLLEAVKQGLPYVVELILDMQETVQ